MEKGIKYLTRLEQIPELTEEERKQLQTVVDKFAYRGNEYYQSLINWDDPNDPIRRIVIPHLEELEEWGQLDASKEYRYTVGPGFQHKYIPTVVLLLTDVCASFCRFCFRKRLFMNQDEEIIRDISQGIEYIRKHKKVTNVLLTGGDPLIMSTVKLEKIIRQLLDIEQVRIVRIGTKIPAYNPYRIVDDPSLLEMVHNCAVGKKIYIMAQFNHPRELTEVAIQAMVSLQKAGAKTYNQTPMIRGVNDDYETLSTLFKELSYHGITPYYVFQCRPTLGNKMFAVPVEESFRIFQQARANCSGLAKSARFVMSHATGKIEIIGISDGNIFFRYHQAAEAKNHGRLLAFRSNPDAYWLDDYKEVVTHYRVEEVFDD
jgi:lysine 2,3-aminomutase